ncbi:acyl-CoA thioesterase [Planctomycetota bacterium]|nr:acyl-CoA thioesterase [Planctomycetota bacterium]
MNEPAPNAYQKHITVTPSDLDDQSRVGNVRVLDWMNQAAEEHSSALGFDWARYEAIGGMFVVRKHEVVYFAAAFEGDELTGFTWCTGQDKIRATRQHEIRRKSDGVLIAKCTTLWIFVDVKSGKPKRMPPEVREAFDPAHFV